MKTRINPALNLLAGIVLLLSTAAATGSPAQMPQADDASPPDRVVKLIFIHHSTGENWLRDDYGRLGQALADNNYFVSDTNYGWGPDSVGDRTDIPNWLDWFRSDQTPTYMDALFNESRQNSGYTRLPNDPGSENQIIMFKSCFPNSALEGNPDDPPDPEGWLTVGHAKYVYNEILQYFAARPDKLFVVITAPPLSDSTYAGNARAFNNWLVNDWDEATSTRLTCTPASDAAYSGASALKIDFDVSADSWSTCVLSYDNAQDWSTGSGLSFYIHASQAGIPYNVLLYTGSLDNTEAYDFSAETPEDSAGGWVLVEIPWANFIRASWESDSGAAFDQTD